MTTTNQPPQNSDNDLTEDPIGLGLKRLYNSVLEETVPDDFMNFLSQIDAKANLKSPNTASQGQDLSNDESSIQKL